MDEECAILQVPNPLCQIHTVRLWMKAFIPKEIEGAKLIAAGPHRGKTMLTSPGPINAWFLTDERDFSAEPSTLKQAKKNVMR
jgi:hypothetical protein